MAKKKKDDNGELLDFLSKGKGSRIEARQRMYKGRAYLALNEWIMKDGSWMKTGRGFMIPVSRREEFLGFIDKVVTILDLQTEK